MDPIDEFFISYGYWGMTLASFMAGTFFPFSSEAVMGALLVATGMDPVVTVMSATAGNVAGSMVNYVVGLMCKTETISKWFRIKQSRLDRSQRYVRQYGSWVAFFAFLPILGTAISIALGILRANIWGTLFYTFIGKCLRYIVVAYIVLSLAQ